MEEWGSPTGWDLNPSSWKRRAPVLVGAALGVATCVLWKLTASSSRSSHLAPEWSACRASFLTAFSSLLASEVLGGNRRWRTHPWAVLISGFTSGPLAAVAIMQSIVLQALSSEVNPFALCLTVLAVALVGPPWAEVLASAQHLRRLGRRGRSVRRALFGLDPRRGRPLSRQNPEQGER